MSLRPLRYRGRPRRKAAPQPTTLLTDLTVEEVSLVDKPANNRPWLVKNDGREDSDGVITVVTNTAPERTTALCESAYKALGAVEHALEGRSDVAKTLDISEQGRAKVWDYFGEISYRLDAICELVASVAGNPLKGSLDQAVGGELASIGAMFADLAAVFGVTEVPEETEMEPVTRAEKAGRAMSSRRLRKLAEARAAVDMVGEILADLFSDSGGSDDIMSAAHEKFYPMAKMAAHVDDRLATMIEVLAAGHDDLKTAIAAVRSASVTKSVAPALGSNQIQRVDAPSDDDDTSDGFSAFLVRQSAE